MGVKDEGFHGACCLVDGDGCKWQLKYGGYWILFVCFSFLKDCTRIYVDERTASNEGVSSEQPHGIIILLNRYLE